MGKYVALSAFAAVFLTYNVANVVRWIHTYVADENVLALVPTVWYGLLTVAWSFLLSVYLREVGKRY